MRYFNQAGAHALATSQYYKKQFWAGQFLVERQTQIKMNHNLHMSREDNSLKSKLNRFWEVEAVEQSIMTAEQQACENFQTRWDPIPLIPLPSQKKQTTAIQRNSKKEDKLLSTMSNLQGEGFNHNNNVDYTERCQAF